jgi:hypothetical protein
LAVGSYEEVGAITHRLADQARQAYGPLQGFLGGLTRIVRREAAGGIEFEAGEALVHVLGGALGRTFGIVIELVAFAVRGIEVGVAAQALVDLAAEEVVHGLLTALPMMSQQAISRPLTTPMSDRSGRRLKPEP